jgi:hypothetical protein
MADDDQYATSFRKTSQEVKYILGPLVKRDNSSIIKHTDKTKRNTFNEKSSIRCKVLHASVVISAFNICVFADPLFYFSIISINVLYVAKF